MLDLPPRPDCAAYVPDELKADTPHAAPPAGVAAVTGAEAAAQGHDLMVLKNWIDFGIAEVGQTDKANADRRAERHIRDVCEAKYQEALDQAKRATRPWYKRIF